MYLRIPSGISSIKLLSMFISRRSSSDNSALKRIFPSSANEINPISNSASWMGQRRRALSMSVFSEESDFAHGLIWLAISNCFVFRPQIWHAFRAFNTFERNFPWLTLVFSIASLSHPSNSAVSAAFFTSSAVSISCFAGALLRRNNCRLSMADSISGFIRQ